MIVCMSYMHTHGNVIIPYYKRITLQNIRNFIRKWSYLINLQLQCELQQVHNQGCMEQRYTVTAILDSWTHIIYVYIRIYNYYTFICNNAILYRKESDMQWPLIEFLLTFHFSNSRVKEQIEVEVTITSRCTDFVLCP